MAKTTPTDFFERLLDNVGEATSRWTAIARRLEESANNESDDRDPVARSVGARLREVAEIYRECANDVIEAMKATRDG